VSTQPVRDLQEDPLARTVFDALPMLAFLLDEERRIHAVNRTAQAVLGSPEARIVGSRPGEALCCLNHSRAAGGCGTGPACEQCLLRRSADEALAGGTVSQREVRIRVACGDEEEDRFLLLSASPFASGGQTLGLVLLQDVTFLHRLRGLIPICAGCKKIRRDDEAWEALEVFLEAHSKAAFTHSLCPECLERLYPELHVPRAAEPSEQP